MLFVKLRTVFALGIVNVLRVARYRIRLKFGSSKIRLQSWDFENGPYFAEYIGPKVDFKVNSNWIGKHSYFGKRYTDSEVPNWHKNILTSKVVRNDKKWFEIDDFDNDIGDIKGVWEASRFEWAIGFAQSYKAGNKESYNLLNQWIDDWIGKNPFSYGVNWKCGQEASIRLMHLALSASILEQTKNSTKALLNVIKGHLKRIAPTIEYAIAQDNNHGTSEAAALFIGGSWLTLNGDSEGERFFKTGLKWLENRALKLIAEDGSFSQYSINYHRVMLDTYCFVETWRSKHSLNEFSSITYQRLQAATYWLYVFTNPVNGDAPNIGANDGARILPLTASDYRDYRPTVQLASALFLGKKAYQCSEDINLPLKWLEIPIPTRLIHGKQSSDFSDGGFAYLKSDNAELYFRYPNFRFRPSQSDSLHVDLWLNDVNALRDGGTYSYNGGVEKLKYYSGARSHNTIEFDDHDQMPRLSRFLYGDWLKPSSKEELVDTSQSSRIGCGYKDQWGCQHQRAIELDNSRLLVNDIISGFREKAVLRWRLSPIKWTIEGNSIESDLCIIKCDSNVQIQRFELSTGEESRYYYQECQIPVLEIEVDRSCTMTTEVIFKI